MTATALRHELLQSYAFVARNFNLTKRYWGWELVWLSYSTASSLAVTFIAAGASEVTGQTGIDVKHFTLYLLLGTLIWHFMSIMFTFVSEVIAWERWEGTIEYTLMAPVHRWVHLIGQTLYAVIYSFISTLIIGTIMALFFEINLADANFLSALVVLMAGSISLIGIGIFASILPLLYPERGAQMTHIIQAAFLLVSGVYYPISVLPDWLEVAARISPVTYVLDGIRAAIMDNAPLSDMGQYVMPLLILGAITLPMGVWAFGQAEHYAKRTGKLKRVG
ncbi:MAG: ABC transporter permease [Chloroflexi bacterium]|nr:MAG: ABC transporter [Phototrophicales bacterium]RMF79210.1 MAG: ABC transporter permease [Chloroflexota bacterium]